MAQASCQPDATRYVRRDPRRSRGTTSRATVRRTRRGQQQSCGSAYPYAKRGSSLESDRSDPRSIAASPASSMRRSLDLGGGGRGPVGDHVLDGRFHGACEQRRPSRRSHRRRQLSRSDRATTITNVWNLFPSRRTSTATSRSLRPDRRMILVSGRGHDLGGEPVRLGPGHPAFAGSDCTSAPVAHGGHVHGTSRAGRGSGRRRGRRIGARRAPAIPVIVPCRWCHRTLGSSGYGAAHARELARRRLTEEAGIATRHTTAINSTSSTRTRRARSATIGPTVADRPRVDELQGRHRCLLGPAQNEGRRPPISLRCRGHRRVRTTRLRALSKP